MGRSYFCPHCMKLLNPGTKVIFLVDTEAGCDLMLLSPTLGDYTAVYARSVQFEEGTLYTFRCPVCRSKVGAFKDIGPRDKPSGFEENLNFGLGVRI